MPVDKLGDFDKSMGELRHSLRSSLFVFRQKQIYYSLDCLECQNKCLLSSIAEKGISFVTARKVVLSDVSESLSQKVLEIVSYLSSCNYKDIVVFPIPSDYQNGRDD